MAGAARGQRYLCAGTQSASEFERNIAWNDPAIAIQWRIEGEPISCAKNQQAKSLAEAECFACPLLISPSLRSPRNPLTRELTPTPLNPYLSWHWLEASGATVSLSRK